MMSFLHTMASASMRVGIVDAMPPESVIKKLSKDMFAEADENNDGGINSREWLQPCRRLRLCAALNVGLRRRRVHELGAQAWYVANLQLVVSCGTSHMRACDSPVVSQRLIAAFSQARQAAGVDPKKLRSIGDGRRDNRASVMATGQAMARAAAARKRAVRRIAQTTAFGVQEMRVIKHAFVREVGYNGALSRDQVLSVTWPRSLASVVIQPVLVPQFCAILTKKFRGITSKEANELFTGFDTDGGGELDFSEFATGMIKTLRASTIDKVRGG